MTEVVIALLMLVNNEIKEHRIQPSMSACLKGKRVANRVYNRWQKQRFNQGKNQSKNLYQNEMAVRIFNTNISNTKC